MKRSTLNDYMQSYQLYFWEWAEEGSVLNASNGRTIAFAPYIAQILWTLGPRPIPRFGPLLLTILATAPNPEEDIRDILAKLKSQTPGLNQTHIDSINDAEHFLLTVARVPSKYKKGKARLYCLQTLFSQTRHAFFSDLANHDIFTTFHRSHLIAKTYLDQLPLSLSTLYSDFHPFIALRNRFPSPEAIVEEMYGLPEIEADKLLDPEEEAPDPGEGFFEALINNKETFHAGALIKRIWSGLDIPRHNRLPGQHPMGGVSDLANKGDLHRLLSSEYANDELLFLSRLANNEALYFQREIPPLSDDRERIILIDVSIKNWGVPRTIAMAIMLAIARHPTSRIPCSAYAVGQTWRPLRYGDVLQVVESMQALEACLHPVEGLEGFFRQNPEKKHAEIFLISSSETLKLPAMQQAAPAFQAFLSYWILCGRDGEIRMYKKRNQGKQHVNTLRLPLEELWRKKTRKTIPDKEPVPANYPLLFPPPLAPKALIYYGHETFAVSRHGTLLQRMGGRISYWKALCENLPPEADHFEAGIMANRNVAVLAFDSRTKQALLMNTSTGYKKEFNFLEWDPKRSWGFIFFENAFYSLGVNIYALGLEMDKIEQKSYLYNYHLANATKTKKKENNLSTELAKKTLRKIARAYVNHERNLVFDGYELSLQGGKFWLKEKHDEPHHIIREATPTGENEFTFHDGSRVFAHPDGMLILKSSDAEIPDIYVPPIVETSLCLATSKTQAGDEQFIDREDGRNVPPAFFKATFLQPFALRIAPYRN